MVTDSHAWLGLAFKAKAECQRSLDDYRSLRESEIFAEVGKAWDSSPTEMLKPVKDVLRLVAEPHDDSEAYHVVANGSNVKGWVGGTSLLWDERYVSMLVYSIDDNLVTTNTGVFFKVSEAVIEPYDDREKEDHDEDSRGTSEVAQAA